MFGKTKYDEARAQINALDRSLAIIEFSMDGTILHANENFLKAMGYTLDELKGQLSKQAELRDQLFAQEMSSQKDRERLLAEKFKEAMKNADKETGQPYRNPLDMD